MSIGGSIKECSIRGRVFPVRGDADAKRVLGGYQNEVRPNGDGRSAVKVMKATSWSISGLTLHVDDIRGDQEFLEEVAASHDYVPITLTLASDVTYQGLGTITDEYSFSTESSSVEVTLAGPGKLTRQ